MWAPSNPDYNVICCVQTCVVVSYISYGLPCAAFLHKKIREREGGERERERVTPITQQEAVTMSHVQVGGLGHSDITSPPPQQNIHELFMQQTRHMQRGCKFFISCCDPTVDTLPSSPNLKNTQRLAQSRYSTAKKGKFSTGLYITHEYS